MSCQPESLRRWLVSSVRLCLDYIDKGVQVAEIADYINQLLVMRLPSSSNVLQNAAP